MVRSSLMTTVTSVWETRALTGRQARLRSWFPVQTAAALVSPFTSLYSLLLTVTATVSAHVRSTRVVSPPSCLILLLREIFTKA